MLPTDLINIILDYKYSMSTYENRQVLNSQFRKLLNTFHINTIFSHFIELNDNEWNPQIYLRSTIGVRNFNPLDAYH